MNLADVFVSISNACGEREALIAGETAFTYRQLVARASQIARTLREDGIGKGDRVVLALESPVETILTAVGLWMLDATVLVADFRSRAEERNRLSESFGIRACLESRSAVGDSDYPSLVLSADWMARADRMSDTVPAPGHTANPAMIIQTSGTTGLPAGVQREHESFLLRNILDRVGGNRFSGGRLLVAQPLSFAAPITKVLCHLLDAGTVHIVPVLSAADEIVEAIHSISADKAFLVPRQLNGLLGLGAPGPAPLFPGLKVLLVGGAPTSAEDNIRAYRDLTPAYQVNYASTMTNMISENFGPDIERRPESVGRPNPLNLVQTVDSDGNPVAAGDPGLIRVRGPAVAYHIIGDPGDKTDRITDDGWVIPGDIGVLDEEGFLTLTGRASDMVVRAGVTIYPAEIEASLRQLDRVKDVAVVGYPDPVVGEELAAFVVSDGPLTVEEVMAQARVRLGPDKRPRTFRLVDALPYSGMGKLLRKELVKQLT